MEDEDPYASFIANCNYSSSQEDLFNHSLHTREDQHLPDLNLPEPYPPPPSTAADVFAVGGIVICSAPETPPSHTVATPSGEDFRTPPEESRRSSSEEPPPSPPPLQELCSRGGGLKSPGLNGVRDPRARDGGTPDLGFSQEKNRNSKMVEVLSSGKVRVGEVSKVDRESFRVRDKRSSQKRSPIQESPHSKRIRVSGKVINIPNLDTREKQSMVQEQSHSKRIRVPGKLINTPNLETREKRSPIQESPHLKRIRAFVKLINTPNLETREKRSPIQESSHSKRIRASGKLINTPNLETREKQSPIQAQSHSKRVRVSGKLINTPNLEVREEGECLVKRRIEFQIEMEVNGKMNVEAEEVDTEVIEDSDEKSCEDDMGISNLQQAQEIEGEMENGNGNREAGGDSAKDLSRQGRRELPSWARRKEDNREKDDNRLNTEHAVDDDMKVVLEVLALLAREAGPSRGTGDILETVKCRGLTFPVPKWWHDEDEDNDL